MFYDVVVLGLMMGHTKSRDLESKVNCMHVARFCWLDTKDVVHPHDLREGLLE